jgi:coenzyme Q-binding protein COQ10
VFCVPGTIVEALSGEGARSGIAPDVLARHGLRDEPSSSSVSTSGSTVGYKNSGVEGVFKNLVTRWTVTPVEPAPDRSSEATVPQAGCQTEWSDVHLDIRFQFANPLYGAVSSAVADKVAPIMIEAFVERARRVLK